MSELIGYNIPGWFRPEECNKLYKLTKETTGNILEIGHFFGRSTAFICQAIRDSNQERVFRSYDLGFKNYDEVQEFYTQMYGLNIAIPSQYKIAFSQNKTTTDIAYDNLKEINLESYVNLISGNFIHLDFEKYNFIFCDAMHDLTEIKNNLPYIITHSNKTCIWAFHDMTLESIQYVESISNAKFLEITRSLGIFKFYD